MLGARLCALRGVELVLPGRSVKPSCCSVSREVSSWDMLLCTWLAAATTSGATLGLSSQLAGAASS